MKKSKNSDGFSIFHALLLLVIVGIAGFIGWYVFHARQVSNENNLVAANSTVPTSKKQTVKKQTIPQTTTPPSSSGSSAAPAHNLPAQTSQGSSVTPSPKYATSIQILSISDSDVISFQLNGFASTKDYYQNWTASPSSLTGHIEFSAAQTSPDSILTTRFETGPTPASQPNTYSVQICENGGQGICSNTYQAIRLAGQ